MKTAINNLKDLDELNQLAIEENNINSKWSFANIKDLKESCKKKWN